MSERGRLRTRVGEVVSDKMNKTITVRVERRVVHPVYGRVVRRSVKLHAEDTDNTCKVGDVVRVEIAHVDVDRRELDFRLVSRLKKAPSRAPKSPRDKRDGKKRTRKGER